MTVTCYLVVKAKILLVIRLCRDMRASLEVAIAKVLRIHNNFITTVRMNQLKLNSANTESDDEVISVLSPTAQSDHTKMAQ